MTAPFLPNAAYTNSRAALEGAPKRHAFFAGRGVALVAGCLGGRVGDGGGLAAGCLGSRWRRLAGGLKASWWRVVRGGLASGCIARGRDRTLCTILRRRRFSRPGLFLSASENDHLKSCIARDLCHGVPPFAVGSMRMRICRAPAASRSSGSRLYRCCDGGCAPPPLGFSAGGGICGKRVKPPVPATRCDAACADGAPFAKPVSDARPSCDQRRSSRAFCAQELLFKR